MNDIRWSKPTVPAPNSIVDKDAECIADPLHVHVWPDVAGINVTTHGMTITLGMWPRDCPSGGKVKPGPFFEWRTARALRRLSAKVDAIKAKHASIDDAYWRVQDHLS